MDICGDGDDEMVGRLVYMGGAHTNSTVLCSVILFYSTTPQFLTSRTPYIFITFVIKISYHNVIEIGEICMKIKSKEEVQKDCTGTVFTSHEF